MFTLILVTILEKVLKVHTNTKVFSMLFIIELVFYMAVFAGLMGSRVYEIPSFMHWLKEVMPR
jgi:hypothetical protein